MTTFSVTASGGFKDPSGQSFNVRGLNATVPDAAAGFSNVMLQYPGLTTLRLACNSTPTTGDTAAAIDAVITQYTGIGVVVILEDHYGGETNVAWYRTMAQTYKSNPRVFLETPNEPHSTTTAQNQIDIINAIRETGFNNPIGLQLVGGYDWSNVNTVLAAVGKLFVAPHIYSSDTSATAPAAYVASTLATASGAGLFPVIDEFGNALDGVTLDPHGDLVISSVIAANQAGQAGAVFWAMDNGNHSNGADSAFLLPNGSSLTVTGVALQPWLSDWRYVQGARNPFSSTNSISATLAAAVGSGNVLVGGVTWDTSGSVTLSSITDDKGNSYTILDNYNNTANGQACASFICGNITNGPTVITANFSGSAGYQQLVVDEYHGAAAAANPNDGHAGQIQSSVTAAATSPSITTTFNTDLIYGLTFNTASATAPGAGAGFTPRQATGLSGIRSEDTIQTTAGSVAATFAASSGNLTSFVIAIKRK